jgi:hypothetical protein
MNNRSDIDRVMEVWMADGPTAIPDRVVDVVAARIGVQRQRRAWPFQRRTNVTTQIKLIAGLAAALVIAVVGYSLLPGRVGPGTPSSAPTASAQPTVAPTAAVTAAPPASVDCPQWLTTGCFSGAGILSAGSHATRTFNPGFTFSVPEGWVNDTDQFGVFNLFADTPANQAEFARSEGLPESILMGPLSSPYFRCESWEDNRGATAAEMAAAVTANEALETTGLVDVEIGGLTGKQFDVRIKPDWTEACPGDPPGLDLGDMRSRGILLDAPGRGVLVIFVGGTDFEAFLAEAMPIIESFEFEP